MPYTRVNWENLPSTNTPTNATNFDHMDIGIKENSDNIELLNTFTTSERAIGTWMDGKTLYAKGYNTYTTGTSGTDVLYYFENGTNFAKDIDIKKYDYSVKIEYLSSGNYLKAYNGSNGVLGTFYFGDNITGGNVYIGRSSFNANYNVISIEATIYYTKSSD